jgi:LIVCS family branched-chain amino acid:cation transporter
MKKYAHIFIYGFAIFSMFFGSGNLVFPIQIGQYSGIYWFMGLLGLFVTGILLPFLGLYVIKIHKGSSNAFFAEAGTIAGAILPFFILSLMGSFGVIPRCITVAHGGIEYLFPKLSLFAFSFIFSVICFIACIKEHFMVDILGKWMTPILLICLGILLFIGVGNAAFLPDVVKQGLVTRAAAFTNGFVTGYQTMDLFAAFFFSALIFNQVQARLQNASDKDILKAALKPSIIASCLLAIIYLGFVYLGAHYKTVIAGVSPEQMLPTIASHLMGKNAVFLIAVIVLFSCLTTAVALNNIYAHYLCGVFKIRKENFLYVLAGTTFISFIISLMDFKGIAAILGPILEVTYPSIILLTILSIFVRGKKYLKIFLFYAMLAITLFWKVMNLHF